MKPYLLTVEQIREMHLRLVSLTREPDTVRDENLLHSALAAPENGRLYEGHDLFEMAADYAFHLACNHPFVEGNKRIGALAADVFLQVNGILFNPDPEEYAKLILNLVTGRISKKQLAAFFRTNSSPV